MNNNLLDELRTKGYDIEKSKVIGYRIKQGFYAHSLSNAEAEALNAANLEHPVDLFKYSRFEVYTLIYEFE